MRIEEVLRVLVDALGDRFAVIGAVARNAWAPPRATTDLDLAVAAVPEVIDAGRRALEGLGYSCAREQRTDPSEPLPDILIFRHPAGELKQVDLLVGKTAFEEEVLQRGVTVQVAGIGVRVATPEDLIIYKLIADRPRDRDDIRSVIQTLSRTGRQVDWEHVERWCRVWEVMDRLAALRAAGD